MQKRKSRQKPIDGVLKRQAFPLLMNNARIARRIAAVVSPVLERFHVCQKIGPQQCLVRERLEVKDNGAARREIVLQLILPSLAAKAKFAQCRPIVEAALRTAGFGAYLLEDCVATPKPPPIVFARNYRGPALPKNDEAAARALEVAEGLPPNSPLKAAMEKLSASLKSR